MTMLPKQHENHSDNRRRSTIIVQAAHPPVGKKRKRNDEVEYAFIPKDLQLEKAPKATIVSP